SSAAALGPLRRASQGAPGSPGSHTVVCARGLHGVLRGAGVRRLLSEGDARPDPPLARRGLSLETERRGPLRAASAVRPRERTGGSRQAGPRGEIVLAGP